MTSGFAALIPLTIAVSAATEAARMTFGSIGFSVAARNSSSNTWLYDSESSCTQRAPSEASSDTSATCSATRSLTSSFGSG